MAFTGANPTRKVEFQVGHNNNITGSLRGLFTVAKNMITSQWPESELPLIRHPEMAGNEELQFWDDMRYLHELQKDILAEIREGGFVWEMPHPVESQRQWTSLKNDLDRELLAFAHLFEVTA